MKQSITHTLVYACFFFFLVLYIYLYIYIKFNCDDEPCIVYIEKQFEEKKMINIGI